MKYHELSHFFTSCAQVDLHFGLFLESVCASVRPRWTIALDQQCCIFQSSLPGPKTWPVQRCSKMFKGKEWLEILRKKNEHDGKRGEKWWKGCLLILFQIAPDRFRWVQILPGCLLSLHSIDVCHFLIPRKRCGDLMARRRREVTTDWGRSDVDGDIMSQC